MGCCPSEPILQEEQGGPHPNIGSLQCPSFSMRRQNQPVQQIEGDATEGGDDERQANKVAETIQPESSKKNVMKSQSSNFNVVEPEQENWLKQSDLEKHLNIEKSRFRSMRNEQECLEVQIKNIMEDQKGEETEQAISPASNKFRAASCGWHKAKKYIEKKTQLEREIRQIQSQIYHIEDILAQNKKKSKETQVMICPRKQDQKYLSHLHPSTHRCPHC